MDGLAGKRVLIVEDEPVIAFLLEDMIDELGMTVAARASTLAEASELARAPSFDAAIFDINLHGQMSYPAAELLARQGVPLVFVSGYAREGVPPALANAPLVAKPYLPHQIAAALARVLGLREGPCRPS